MSIFDNCGNLVKYVFHLAHFSVPERTFHFIFFKIYVLKILKYQKWIFSEFSTPPCVEGAGRLNYTIIYCTYGNKSAHFNTLISKNFSSSQLKQLVGLYIRPWGSKKWLLICFLIMQLGKMKFRRRTWTSCVHDNGWDA